MTVDLTTPCEIDFEGWGSTPGEARGRVLTEARALLTDCWPERDFEWQSSPFSIDADRTHAGLPIVWRARVTVLVVWRGRPPNNR